MPVASAHTLHVTRMNESLLYAFQDPKKRATVDQILQHPWMKQQHSTPAIAGGADSINLTKPAAGLQAFVQVPIATETSHFELAALNNPCTDRVVMCRENAN